MAKKVELHSPNYLEIGMHIDGKESLILRVPTFWDEEIELWIAAIRTPITKKLLTATGKDVFVLQNNFNKMFAAVFQDDILTDEIYSMFKPLYVWETLESRTRITQTNKARNAGNAGQNGRGN